MKFLNLEESELHLTIHKIKGMYWLFSLCFYPCDPLFFYSIEVTRKTGT